MTCWASQADADRAASEAVADKWAEFVALFHDEAADEALRNGGAVDLLYWAEGRTLDALFQAVLHADNGDAAACIFELRDALRAEAWRKYGNGLTADAERLAKKAQQEREE